MLGIDKILDNVNKAGLFQPNLNKLINNVSPYLVNSPIVSNGARETKILKIINEMKQKEEQIGVAKNIFNAAAEKKHMVYQ